jgi:hypothetical protein
MSDRLAALMRDVIDQMPKKEMTHDEALIEALDKALESTTPARPGCPWDKEWEGDREPEEPGVWIPEAGD